MKPVIVFTLVLLNFLSCKSWGKFWQTEIQYSSNPLLLTQNVAMTAVTPTMPGVARSCSVSPALPEGLSLASDCTISGTPTRGQGALPYKVTADIGSDSVSGELRIRVLFQPKFVYVANTGSNNVSAYSINADGSLNLPTNYTVGTSPRFVLVHPAGRYLYTANHGSANISVLEITQATGALTTASSPFNTSANPYSLAFDPQGRFLYVGHEDAAVAAVSAYTVNTATGELTQVAGSPFAVAAGATPVSVHVSPDGNHLYVGSSQSAINAHAFSIDQSTGALTQIQGSPFTLINDAISVFAHPSGRFVYFAQYFSPTGAVGLSRDSASGALSLLPGSPYAAGLAPGYITGDPLGRYVYIANSGDTSGTAGISGFTVNATTGELLAMAGSPFAASQNPIGFALDETARFGYAANSGSGQVSAYRISSATGALTQTAGSPFTAGTSPFSVIVAGSNPQ
jgi:6-phosphogluconolactonase (cycloisomerase 2 family)